MEHADQPARVTAERASEARRRRPLAWAVAAAVVALLALLAYAVLHPAADNPLTAVNRPAPDFTMSLYDGGTLNLKALRGKTVVVNFWWSGCAPCVQEAPILQRQWQAWKGKDVVFVGIDEIDDPHTSAPRQFLHQFGVTYPNGWDPGDVDIQFGTTGQPETFFITPRGTIVKRYAMPFADEKTLSDLIRATRA